MRADREEHTVSRLAGKAAIHSRLATRADTKEAGLKIFADLRPPRARPATAHLHLSRRGSVDSDVAFDHSYDALRYLLNRKSSRARMVGIAAL